MCGWVVVRFKNSVPINWCLVPEISCRKVRKLEDYARSSWNRFTANIQAQERMRQQICKPFRSRQSGKNLAHDWAYIFIKLDHKTCHVGLVLNAWLIQVMCSEKTSVTGCVHKSFSGFSPTFWIYFSSQSTKNHKRINACVLRSSHCKDQKDTKIRAWLAAVFAVQVVDAIALNQRVCERQAKIERLCCTCIKTYNDVWT